jgi:hypothetical protein
VAHRTACLRHDDIGQATLLNLLLRGLLAANQVDAADKLASKAPFPEAVSNNQLCRYLYYRGGFRGRAVGRLVTGGQGSRRGRLGGQLSGRIGPLGERACFVVCFALL